MELKDTDQQEPKPGSGMVGFAYLALCVVGIGAAIVAFDAYIQQRDALGTGVCAIASALSFGLLLNASLRA